MSDASLTGIGDMTATIRFERHLSQPPSEVWRAITDHEELKAWFPCDIATEHWQVGAKLRFTFRENQAAPFTGTVLELDEPKVLRYSWGHSVLCFELSPHPAGGTRLVLIEELDPAHASRNAAGWEICLEALSHSSSDEPWRARFERYVALFEPRLGSQEGPPPGF